MNAFSVDQSRCFLSDTINPSVRPSSNKKNPATIHLVPMPKTGAGHVLHHNYNNSVFYVCESHPMKHMGNPFGTIRRHWYDEKGELELK